VRQPLAEAILVVHGDVDLGPYLDVIREELNVVDVRLSDDPAKYVEFEIVPNFRALGPKLGKRMPQCKQALAASDGSQLYDALERKGEITLELADGQPILLDREEIEVRLTAREGYAAASEGGSVVVLDTRVTPELKRAGYAREAINRIQSARKTLNLPYDARIEVVYRTEGDVDQALAEHAEAIAKETLATKFEPGDPAEDAHQTEVEGVAFVFSVRKLPG
jgi:isoleucyl-tRNA synthetase